MRQMADELVEGQPRCSSCIDLSQKWEWTAPFTPTSNPLCEPGHATQSLDPDQTSPAGSVGMKRQGKSLISQGLQSHGKHNNALKSPEAYAQAFCDFLTETPTFWHAVQQFEKTLDASGFKKVFFLGFT